LEIPDDSKVKVTFHDAENESGNSFSTDHEDTYQAVYYVEPQTTGHPVYQISRNILVKEVQTEAESTANTDSSSDDDSGNGETSDSEEELSDTESDQVGQTEAEDVPDKGDMLSEEALDEAIESTEGQKIVDEETGLSLGEVLIQAEEQGVDIQGLDQ